jgi:UDP-glucose 6-dehydrogenase
LRCFKRISAESHAYGAVSLASKLSKLTEYISAKYAYDIVELIGHDRAKSICVLGFGYKSNVSFIDESQAVAVAKMLIEEGYEVYAFDPLAEENAKHVLDGKVTFCSSLEECVEKADILFIGTPNFSHVKTNKPVVNPWK